MSAEWSTDSGVVCFLLLLFFHFIFHSYQIIVPIIVAIQQPVRTSGQQSFSPPKEILLLTRLTFKSEIGWVFDRMVLTKFTNNYFSLSFNKPINHSPSSTSYSTPEEKRPF